MNLFLGNEGIEKGRDVQQPQPKKRIKLGTVDYRRREEKLIKFLGRIVVVYLFFNQIFTDIKS